MTSILEQAAAQLLTEYKYEVPPSIPFKAGVWMGPIYHGSRRKDLKKLSLDASGTGIAGSRESTKAIWLTSNRDNATFYADPHDDDDIDEYVYLCYVKMNNPLEIDRDHDDFRNTHSMYQRVKLAQEKGHDGLIIRDIVDGHAFSDIYAVWDESQVKVKKPLKSTPFIQGAKRNQIDDDIQIVKGKDGYYGFATVIEDGGEDEEDLETVMLGGPYKTEDEAEEKGQRLVTAHNKAIGKG